MQTPENKIASTFYLLFTTLSILVAVSLLVPASFFSSLDLKRVDYIEPLVLKVKIKKPKIQKQIAPPKLEVAKDTFKEEKTELAKAIEYELTTIEDFSESGSQFKLMLGALHNAKTDNCRIAFYGDSFIEGDIMTMNLRDSLQKKFGGRGVGFLPVSSEVSMFRKSLPSESDDWEVYSIAKQSSKKEAYGIAGATYIPNESATLKLIPPKALANISIIYKNNGVPAIIKSQTNKKHISYDTLKDTEALQIQALVEGKDTVKNFKMDVKEGGGLKVYGLSLESGRGVYLDNFSIRGNSGLGLNEIKDDQFREFQSLMNYKLIVLQFGINVSNAEITDFGFYEKGMTKLIRRLKKLFPETAILLISMSDRSHKEDGVYVTMPSVPLLVEAQRNIAFESGVLFWDMYSAMGGENSMVDWVEKKKANKDYTHLTFSGGRQVAGELFKAIMYEYKTKYKITDNENISLNKK